MIQKINEKQNILGDNIGFVENWDFSKANLNEENRILAITQVASICYQNPKALGSESLYNRLAAESQGLPSSSFEFVPVLLDTHKDRHKEILYDSHILSNIYKYGEEIANKYILTNYRAIYYDYEQKIKEIKEYYNSTVASPENDTNYHEDLKILKERYLGLFNTEEECEIIKEHFKVFLFKVDFPTRSQMVRHRVNWQELCISGDSMITTMQGKRSIKTLYENQFRESSNKLPKVRVYDFKEKRLVWSEIKEVFSTGKKQVFEVTIQVGSGNKRKIKSTENHKFLTPFGWKELKDIKPGDFIAKNGISVIDNVETLKEITQRMIDTKVTKKDFANLYNISELALVKKLQKINMVYSDKDFALTNYHLEDWLLENKKLMISQGKNHKEFAQHFDINPNTLNKWFRKYKINYTKEELALTKKEVWNKGIKGEDSHSYGKTFSKERCENISKSLSKSLGQVKCGFAFTVRSYWRTQFRKDEILKDHNNCCAKCKVSLENINFELDHIKPVRLYPNLALEKNNIQPLCLKCHDIKTKEDTLLDDHTYSFNFVESIVQKDIEETYDLEVCHDDHNYVANGLIVHNSRRYVSGKRVPFEFYISEKMKGLESEHEDYYMDGMSDFETDFTNTHSTEKLIEMCIEHYYQALEKGVKPQEARRIIPQAAYTQIWGAFMPKQLDNYFKLRLDESSQWEIRQTAIAMQELLKD